MKEIKEFPGYFITEDGRVFSGRKKRNNKNNGGRYESYIDVEDLIELKPSIDKDGYKRVCLCRKKEEKFKPIHRLVAEAFIENPKNLPQINHIDEDKQTNNVNNLEWVTQQRNIEHSHAKFYVIENIETGEKITIYNLKKWCRENKFHESALLGTLTGKRNHSGGHRIIEKRERE